MKLELAKENLFKMKKLNYFEALQSKLKLIENKEKLEVDIEKIVIIKKEEDYYLQYINIEDEKLITRAEK